MTALARKVSRNHIQDRLGENGTAFLVIFAEFLGVKRSREKERERENGVELREEERYILITHSSKTPQK